jgi:hypothetical protein
MSSSWPAHICSGREDGSLLAGFSSTHGLVLDLTAIELGDRGRRVVSVGPPRGWVSWMSGGPNMGCVTALVISDHVCENSRIARHSDSDR